MNKRLKYRSVSHGNKIRASGSNTGSTNHFKPLFSLEYLQQNYCLSKCDQEEKAAFADALHKRSKLTWNEIVRADRHGLGSENISQSSITAPIPPHITDDVNLIAMRFNGMAPMVGYRRDAVFYIVWIDRDFTLYPH